MGLYAHRNAYLRDPWNVVDFVVVLTSVLEFVVTTFAGDSVPSFKVLRTVRVLRPLRSVKRVPTMRRLVSIMIKSLPELANTLVFLLFFFIVFGIVGIQTFNGAVYQRCRLDPKPSNGSWPMDPSQADFICTPAPDQWNSCREGTFCRSPV
jgi:hypothetical protein